MVYILLQISDELNKYVGVQKEILGVKTRGQAIEHILSDVYSKDGIKGRLDSQNKKMRR